jgi:spore coat protein H
LELEGVVALTTVTVMLTTRAKRGLGCLLAALVGLGLADSTIGQTRKEPVPGAEIFGTGIVHRVGIQLTDQSLDALRKEPREDVKATVQFGTNKLADVGVHLKGRIGSFRSLDDKPALTLDFDKFVAGRRLFGVSKVHLNNSVEDPSYLNEYLGAELFRAAGLPATRVSHAVVEVNGRKLGLYVLKEAFETEFLGLHFKRTDGNLYENDPTEDDPGRMKRDLGKGPDDQGDLKSLLGAAAEPDFERRWQRLQSVLDVDRFLSFMAVELLAGHRDGYCLARNNYRLYHDPGAERFVFLPHGMDQLFGRADLPIRARMSGPVASAIMEMPMGRRLYLERAALMLTNVFKAEVLTNLVDQILPRLRAAGSGDVARELEQGAATVKGRMARRLANLAKQLGEPELQPLRFTDSIARLNDWRALDVPSGGKLEQVNSADGRAAYYISAGPVTSASWRTKVLLQAGRYRFEGAVRTAGVKPMTFGKNKGAGLRVSAAKLAAPHQIIGDTAWKTIGVDFELSAPETEVELICELRASDGEAWFDRDALRLLRNR